MKNREPVNELAMGAPMMNKEIKYTPLKEEHETLGARMVEFAGWWMPVQYQGVKVEHLATRNHVGLFDVSHMGEIFFRGPNALKTLEWLTTNSVGKLGAGEAQYSLLPNEQGGLVDDIIVYCIVPDQEYLVCVNASNIEKDLDWMLKNNLGAEIINESEKWAQIAVQGPKALPLMKRVLGPDAVAMGSFQFRAISYGGVNCWVARTGYTGEDGGEIFVPREVAVRLWRDLLTQGQDLGATPIGLAARDTLRTEMKYSLYGHEIDDRTNPYAAGLGWVVKPQLKDFMGKAAMLAQKEMGLTHKLVGFELTDRGVPREGYRLFSFDNMEIGKVTSGTMSPSLDKPIGIGMIKIPWSDLGNEFTVDIRGRRVKAKVVSTPFVKPKGGV
jgi:aminomethyltransferase